MSDVQSPSKVPMLAGKPLAAINPTTFDEVTRLAKVAVMAGLAASKEDDEQKAIAKATMAILHGLEVGIPAVQAVQNISIVNGKPMIYGDLLTAVLWSKGFKVKKWVTGEGDARIGNAQIIRPDGTIIDKSFSVAQAKKARLWDTRERVTRNGKNGQYTVDNDSPWYRFDERMLEWRAFGFACKDGASDATRGMLVYEEASPDANRMVDVTPHASAIEELPDIPDGTDEPRQTDAQFLEQFKNLVAVNKADTSAAAEIYEAHLDEIVTRGLEQECNDIINSLCGNAEPVEKPVAATVSSTVSTQETLDIPWEDEADKSADKVVSPFGSDAAATALENFRKQVAMCHNLARAKQLWKSWEETVSEFDAETQQQFGRIYDDASARIRKAVREAAE